MNAENRRGVVSTFKFSPMQRGGRGDLAPYNPDKQRLLHSPLDFNILSYIELRNDIKV